MHEPLDVELALTAAAIGLVPPPVPVDARLARDGAEWRVVARASAGDAARTAEWLKRIGATSVVPPTRPEGTIVSAGFDVLALPLARAAERLRVRELRLAPGGEVQLVATADRDALHAFMNDVPGARIKRCGPARVRPRRLLTPRQEEVLARAVAEGYYRVPRDITLVQLARKCGVSTSSLSEILRRAEGRVIQSYAEWGNTNMPAEESTLEAFRGRDGVPWR